MSPPIRSMSPPIRSMSPPIRSMSPPHESTPLTLCPPALVLPPYGGGQIPPCVNGLGKTLDLSISSKVGELCQIRENVF